MSEVYSPIAESLTKRDRTVLIISHKMEFASIADHVVVLGADGTVEQQGAPSNLVSEDGPFRDLQRIAKSMLYSDETVPPVQE